jgi:hypothetical protein
MLVITDQRRFVAQDGTAGAPSFTFVSDQDTGLFWRANNFLSVAVGGVNKFEYGTSFMMASDRLLSWGSTTDVSTSVADVVLQRDAADTLAQRRGTNAQVFKVYNTFTDASNYERSFIGFGGNRLFFATERGGTGVERDVEIRGASIHFSSLGGSRWLINATGHFIASADNSYDIGASGANRPRSLFLAGHAFAGADGRIGWAGRGDLVAPADGVFTLRDAATTGFNRLQFGGTTSSFPALKRTTTNLQARLADDSGFAPIQGILKSHDNAVAETPSASHTITIQDASGTSYKVLCVPA